MHRTNIRHSFIDPKNEVYMKRRWQESHGWRHRYGLPLAVEAVRQIDAIFVAKRAIDSAPAAERLAVRQRDCPASAPMGPNWRFE
jgi:hypothetical protein